MAYLRLVCSILIGFKSELSIAFILVFSLFFEPFRSELNGVL